MSPYKNLDERRKVARKGMAKRYFAEELRKFEDWALITSLASAPETEPLLVRIVAINFEKARSNSTKKYSLHLSRLAVNKEKYIETLKATNFPYRVDFGDFYLIKRATEEEIETFLADRTAKLTEFLDDLKELRKKRGKKR